MIISDSHKFVFVHIPRTGGASIRDAVLTHLAGDKQTITRGIHRPLTLAYSRKYKHYYKFCMVRNPWARYASLFKFQVNRNEVIDDFDRYIYSIMEGKTRFRFYAWNQILFGVERMDFVGRFDNLEKDFHHFCRMVGLPELELPHHHNEGEYDYRDMYNAITRDLITDHCQKEIKLFNFKF